MRHHPVRSHSRVVVSAATLALAAGAAFAGDVAPKDEKGGPPAQEAKELDALFNKLLEKVRSAAAGAAEGDVKKLLESARRVGRPFPAALAAKPYLTRNLNPSADVLILAAENARLVGDFRTAVSRYKSYLGKAARGEQSSDAAADLYVLLIDFLGAADDAFQWMREHGSNFREGTRARKFDAWFLDEARRRNDVVAHASGLALVMEQGLPLEQERYHFWHHLDWLMLEMSRARKEHYEALPSCRSIVRAIRDSRSREARYALYVANLECKAGSAGKDEAALAREFEAVEAAVQRYLDAFPTADALKVAVHALAGGHGQFHDGEWGRHKDRKSRLLLDAFGKLDADGRRAILAWERDRRPMLVSLVSGEQMVELALEHLEDFKKSGAISRLPFAYRTTDPELRAKEAQFLKGVPSRPAAVVNSLVASDDLVSCAMTLLHDEAWHLGFRDLYDLIKNHMYPVHEGERGRDNLPAGFFDQVVVEFGREGLAKTPLAVFDFEATRQFVSSAWREAGRGRIERSDMVDILRSLDWVPFSQRDRKEVFNWANGEFRRWANSVRRNKRSDPRDVRLIGPLGEAFKRAMDTRATDRPEALDDLTKDIVACVKALSRRDRAGFLKIGRGLYERVRDYEEKKTAFGRATISYLLENRPRELDTFDLQCHILADILSRYETGGSDDAVSRVVSAIAYKRWNNLSDIQSKDRAKAKKLCSLFCDALVKVMDRGEFSPLLFNYVRATRRGRNWSDPDQGADILERMIREKTLLSHKYRPDWRVKSAATGYMWLVRNEFPNLGAKYPCERYFDDMFVEEARETRFLDWAYWDSGHDSRKKVANAAAQILGSFERLPFGYGDDDGATYSRDDFWRWQEKALGAEQAFRDGFIARTEARHGATRFDGFAMGGARLRAVSYPKTAAARKRYFRDVAGYIERAKASPVREGPPHLSRLFAFGDAKLSGEELDALVNVFPDCTPSSWWRGWSFEKLPGALQAGLAAEGRQAELYALIPHFWKIARDTGESRVQRGLVDFARKLMARKEFDLAAAYSAVGMEMLSSRLADDVRNSLLSMRSKALVQVGTAIPVPRTDPRYPVYAAQAHFNSGNVRSAWELYLEHSKQAVRMLRELDPDFALWVIARSTEARDFDQAERLARQMMQWVDKTPESFDPEVRARLLLTYADISFARQQYPRARAQYSSIAAAKEFQSTRARDDAEIKIAAVDRLTKQYDRAVERLEKLVRSAKFASNKHLQTEAYFGLALVKYDQEEYAEAKDVLDNVFVRATDHAEARILEGRLYLKLKKLVEATEIKVGISASKRTIVPGKPLKVTLEDRNLSVVGKSSSVGIHAWTDSGDDEVFTLMPFGDSKTKFHGQIATALAPATKRDHSLQVLGTDKVYYDFSDAFKRAHKLPPAAPRALSVTTDAELYVSSGKILTREQQEELALERMIRSQLKMQKEEGAAIALSERRAMDQVKPGNRMNIRVIDADRSATAGKDALTVKVSASSGDAVASFTLSETETHSGVFEGSVPTASARATAYASDTKEGTLPNFVISSGDYAPWVALPDNVRPKSFSVDLNDNVALGPMAVRADVPGRKLKRFAVRTSLDGRQFRTVAAWPDALEPLETPLGLEIAKIPSDYLKNVKLPNVKLDDIREYLDVGHFGAGQKKVRLTPSRLGVSWDHELGGLARRIDANHREEWFVARVYGWFYTSTRQVRTFKLDRKDRLQNITYFLVVDGEVADVTAKKGEDLFKREGALFTVRKAFTRGPARVEVYVCARRDSKPEFEVLCDREGELALGPCPGEMFDTAAHPELRTACASEYGKVEAKQDGSFFEIDFPPLARARVIRLLMADFETDAPAINKVTLESREGERILPTEEDLMSLNENAVLEIVPGDRITVRYEDPKVVTRGNEVHEAFMTATFTDAELTACFTKYTIDNQGERKARYVPMRRFKAGDRITVVVVDPDEDMTDEQDSVKFTAKTVDGQSVTADALETESHSGVFIGGVFPVTGEPNRKTEISVNEGDGVFITYADMENTDYGIKWDRTTMVEQVWYQDPELRIYDVRSMPIPEEEAAAAKAKKAAARAGVAIGVEHVPATRTLVAERPASPERDGPAPVLMGSPLIAEVLFPTIALSPESEATLYVQTSSGRKAGAAKRPEGEPELVFDLRVPGTIKLTTTPSDAKGGTASPGYKGITVVSDRYATTPLDDGRFTVTVPMVLASVPERSLVDAEPEPGEQLALAVRGGDEVFIGLRYEDELGEEKWLARSARLGADVFFDVMDRRYQKEVESAYVGETVYFRVIHKSMDTTDEKDQAKVELTTSAGEKKTMTLVETFEHTGEFKGLARFVYGAGEGPPAAPAPAVAKAAGTAEGAGKGGDPDAMPVRYGDVVTVAYRPAVPEAGEPPVELVEHEVLVHKGADGAVLPFTKQFKDPKIAVQTQFTVAEAYFELAKKHRKLAKDQPKLESLARREMAHAKKLLGEAIRDYPDVQVKAQAEYLLANLTYEFANLAVNHEIRRKQFAEAVARFNDLVLSYPDSPYAPKAQYKKALVFEKMGEIDTACEEYVKLSYRYPENELVAETIARLGQYFLLKGKDFTAKAKQETNPVEREKTKMRAREMYRTSAEVFGRLAVRFPAHRLAGKTTVLSAQSYMRSEDFQKAIAVFGRIIEDANQDKDVRAEAMYWSGHCSILEDDYVNSYRTLKKLTWDYPESKWAKFARGRLTEPELVEAAEEE